MRQPQPMPLVATTETIAGYRIVRTLGYVESVQGVPDLAARAQQMGGNAVVATRWDRTSFHNGMNETFVSHVYGTAVVALPEDTRGRAESLASGS